MNEPLLIPPKKKGVFSPVLFELAIVILFFALSASIVVQLIAAASRISAESEYHARALLAMETVAEQIKADPADGGDGVEPRLFTVTPADDILIDCAVTPNDSFAGGTLYEISLCVTAPDGSVYSLSAARYVSRGEVAP